MGGAVRLPLPNPDEDFHLQRLQHGGDDHELGPGFENPYFLLDNARYVRVYVDAKGSHPWGASLWDARVCNNNTSSATPPPPPTPSSPQCSDGVDNADPEDTLIDLADPGCSGASDNDETDPAPPPPPARCANGVDDDGDGLVDLNDPGCSGAQDDDETDAPPPVAGVYHVDGRFLEDPCGERMVHRNVEEMLWNTSWKSPQFVNEIGKTGANGVHLNTLMTGTLPGGTQGDTPYTVAQIENVINRGIQSQMLVELSLDNYSRPMDGGLFERADVKALLQRYEKYIAITIKGESYNQTEQQWTDDVKARITRVRNAGYRMPLYVLPVYGGRHLPYILNRGAEIEAFDPLHNTVFVWQGYWGVGNHYQNEFGMTLDQAMQRVANQTFPIVVGIQRWSDGYDPATAQNMDWRGQMQRGQQYNIGWRWWTWRQDNNNLTTTGFFGNWYTHGAEVALTSPYSIQNTSVRTFFQRNGVCQ